MNVRRTAPTEPPVPNESDGALPVKQARSRLLRDRLIAKGRALVEARGFAATSMADIAQASSCSVGALYFRFRDKEALFDCVVESAMSPAMEDIRARAAAGHYDGLSVRETIAACVSDYVAFVRRNEGMIRAIYQRSLEDPRHWQPVRRSGQTMVAVWVDAIARSMGRSGDRAFLRQVSLAFQFVSGVLVHSVLIVSPAIALSQDELIHWQVEMVAHLIAQAPEAGKGMPGKTRR
ncbi:MAG TPA: TetR/AcrR family transcriptional regulator [Burkholderiaceae bacterium]|jgi:AcrR family transcriptional regulator|nr:TetR/AcrR family transcriptional regulator [Burkholderiaceae bacterium]